MRQGAAGQERVNTMWGRADMRGLVRRVPAVWGSMRIIVRVLFASACLVGLAACDVTTKNASLTSGDGATTNVAPATKPG